MNKAIIFLLFIAVVSISGCSEGIDWFFYDTEYDKYYEYRDRDESIFDYPEDPTTQQIDSIMDQIENVIVVEEYENKVRIPCDVDADCSDKCEDNFKIPQQCGTSDEGEDRRASLVEARDNVREKIGKAIFGLRWVQAHGVPEGQKDAFIELVDMASSDIEALKLQEKELDELIRNDKPGSCRPVRGPHEACRSPELCMVIDDVAQCKEACSSKDDCKAVCDGPYQINQKQCEGLDTENAYCVTKLVDCAAGETCLEKNTVPVCEKVCKEYTIPEKLKTKTLERQKGGYTGHTELEFSGSSQCSRGSASKSGHSTKIFTETGNQLFDISRTDVQECNKPGGFNPLSSDVGTILKTITKVGQNSNPEETKTIYFANYCVGTKIMVAYCDASIITKAIDESKIAIDGVPASSGPSRDWSTTGEFTHQIFNHDLVDCGEFKRDDGTSMECMQDESITVAFDDDGMALHPIDTKGNTLFPAYCG